MIKDSVLLFDILIRKSLALENRLMIVLRTIKSAYENMELQDLAFIQSDLNIADGRTNVKKNGLCEKLC